MWGYKVHKWGPGSTETAVSGEKGLSAMLNQLGQDGWELVAVHPAKDGTALYIFKQHLPANSA